MGESAKAGRLLSALRLVAAIGSFTTEAGHGLPSGLCGSPPRMVKGEFARIEIGIDKDIAAADSGATATWGLGRRHHTRPHARSTHPEVLPTGSPRWRVRAVGSVGLKNET